MFVFVGLAGKSQLCIGDGIAPNGPLHESMITQSTDAYM